MEHSGAEGGGAGPEEEEEEEQSSKSTRQREGEGGQKGEERKSSTAGEEDEVEEKGAEEERKAKAAVHSCAAHVHDVGGPIPIDVRRAVQCSPLCSGGTEADAQGHQHRGFRDAHCWGRSRLRTCSPLLVLIFGSIYSYAALSFLLLNRTELNKCK